MEWHGEKVLNYWNLFNTLFKSFVGNDSFKTPPVGETIVIHCSGVILSSNLEGSVASSMNSDL